jgi:hypothetical protein
MTASPTASSEPFTSKASRNRLVDSFFAAS